MSDIKTKQQILAELKTYLKSVRNDLDIGDNSLLNDIVLTPLSIGGESIMNQVEIARDLHMLSLLSSADLDNEGQNYRLERSSGTYALGYVTFYANTLPAGTVTIPAATEVTTVGTSFSSPVSYTTISEATFLAASIPNYYSYDRARYEFTIRCICSSIGSTGNSAAGMVTKMSGVIADIDGCTNLNSFTGGQDEESDDDYRVRIQLAMTGRELNTVNGLRKYLRTLGFQDAYPVRPESTDAEKQLGCDVFVIDTYAESYTDTFTYTFAVPPTRYDFTHKPVSAVTSVTGSIVGVISASNYTFDIDSTLPYRRGSSADDHIHFAVGAGLSPGETVTVVYDYYSRIYQTQLQLDSNDNDILTSDPYVKRAYPCYLYLTATLNLKANADGPTTRSRVKSALSQWLSTYRMGDDVQKSDLIVVLQTGYGDYQITTVDSVVISSYYLVDENGVTYNPTVGTEIISVGAKQYVVYGAATIL